MLFKIIPDNFFSPLAFGMKDHYAELLRLYYRRFLEFPGGVEKELLVSDFVSYFERTGDDVEHLVNTADGDEGEETAGSYEKSTRGLALRSLRRLVKCGWMSYSDQSLESRTMKIINALRERRADPVDMAHNLFAVKYADSRSPYNRRRKPVAEHYLEKPRVDPFEAEKAETELRLRIQRQLNPEKIRDFLESSAGVAHRGP